MIDQLVGLVIAGLMLLMGLFGMLRPEIMARYAEDAEAGEPTPARVRQARISAALLFCLAAIGLYAIMTHDGSPVDPLLILPR